MIINQSTALKTFKKEVGQANHMLITILVGLDGIIDKDLTINKEFHAAWNPKDKNASASRARDFAKKSCLAWMVDCIDMYLRLINTGPSIISDTSLKGDMDSENNSQSVYKRLALICKKYKIDDERAALADVIICWRNRLAHYNASNNISKKNKETLLARKDELRDKYRGLDVDVMLTSFENKKPPTFKEVASLVSASIDLVYTLDRSLLEGLDTLGYADQIIVNYIKKGEAESLNELFSNEEIKVNKSLHQILMQSGFTYSEDFNDVDELCKDISKLNFSKAKKQFETGTFISS